MRELWFLSYASDSFRVHQRENERYVERFLRPDRICSYSNTDLERTEFHRKHREILDQERGAGLWLWKPFYIDRTLAEMRENDTLVYYDSGGPAKYRIRTRLPWLRAYCDQIHPFVPGLYAPQHGPNENWCKRDAFVRMGCDTDEFRTTPQVQTTFSVWRNCARSRRFVREWLDWCTDAHVLTDVPNAEGLPNAPGFVDHRHDQSVLTNLVVKHGVPVPNAPHEAVPFDKCITLVDLYFRFRRVPLLASALRGLQQANAVRHVRGARV